MARSRASPSRPSQEAGLSDTSSVLFVAIAGVIIILGIAAVSYYGGCLPGTMNSPSATVHGKSTVDQAAAD